LFTRNFGYGGNQDLLYQALKAGADIVVTLHPDYHLIRACYPM
jgi:hypothetical protein